MTSRKNLRDPLNLGEDFDRRSLEEWRVVAEKALGPDALAGLVSEVARGVTVAPLLTELDAVADPSYPGLEPFTRGSRPLGNAIDGWEICQCVDHPAPAEIARLAADEVRGGATGLWIRANRSAGFELAAADLDPLVTAADPTEVAVRLDGGGHGFALAAAWVAACTGRGIDPSKLRGSFGWDPLGALAANGDLPHDLDTGLALVSELARWTHDTAPGVRAIAVDTLAYHQAGADPVQELAIATSTAVEYLRRMTTDGLALAVAGGQVHFVTAVGRDLFVEMAKLRALRRLWARVTEVLGEGASCPPPSVQAVTSPRCLSRRDPWVNMLRTTVESFAAAAGGADAITVLPFDDAVGAPEELGRRIARNTHAIMMEESHLHQMVDPGGGSYMVEYLSDRLARSAWAAFQEIEHRGGMAAALHSGFVADRLAEAAAREVAAVSTRRLPVTGVSSYPNLDEQPLVRANPATSAERSAASTAADAALGQLRALVSSGNSCEGVFESAVVAAGSDAPVRRLAAAMGAGSDRAKVPALPDLREAEPFEDLRDASDRHLDRTGARPTAFLASIGGLSEHRLRTDFARNLLAAGGIRSVGGDGCESAAEAAAALAASGSRTAVICSSDERDPQLVRDLASALKGAGARHILVVGRPTSLQVRWRDFGVDDFLYAGCDAVVGLKNILRTEGVAVD